MNICEARQYAADNGVLIEEDRTVARRKGCIPDTLAFVVRKRGSAIACYRLGGAGDRWVVAKGMVHDSRSSAIIAAADILLSIRNK